MSGVVVRTAAATLDMVKHKLKHRHRTLSPAAGRCNIKLYNEPSQQAAKTLRNCVYIEDNITFVTRYLSHPSHPLAISNHGKASIPATVAHNVPFDF